MNQMKKHLVSILVLCIFLAPVTVLAQKKDPIPLKYGAQRIGKRTDEAMQQWRDNKFGQIIHFGLYSLLGGYYNGKCYNGAAEWIKSSARIPNAEYEKLASQMALPKFDAKEWARIAKQMGVKYSVITTKHHEGFCLWPSKYTDYTIANTPYGKDLLKEYVDAYNAEGIDVYFYFSIIDWNNKDWRSSIKSKDDSLAFERFKKFTLNQVEELITNYPTVKGFWFDGTWDASMVKSGSFTYDIEKKMHELKPDIICGSRLRVDERGARHFDSNKNLMGDYEQGWERSLPDKPLPNDWEAVMTIPENQWGYHSNWQGHIKSANEIIEMIAKAASLDGNFVLNFGPKGDGSIRKEEQELAKNIGKWMAVNGEAIYNCGMASFKEQKWGYFTANKESKALYMVVTNHPATGQLKVNVPQGTEIDQCVPLNSKTPLKLQKSTKNEYVIEAPKAKMNEIYVLKLTLKKGDSVGNYVAPKM